MIKTKAANGVVTARISGELDHAAAPKIREALDNIIFDPGVSRLILDLKNLTFMDSSGLGVIMGRYRIMSRRSGKMSVTNVPGAVDRVFQLSGIYTIIDKI